LFLKYPNLYLDGCLYHAFKKYRNKGQMDGYKNDFLEGIALLNGEKQNQNIPPGARVRAMRRL